MIDDLRTCATHRQPINRCADCWPMFLAHLGWLCRTVGRCTFLPSPSHFNPSLQEQRVFAKEVGLR